MFTVHASKFSRRGCSLQHTESPQYTCHVTKHETKSNTFGILRTCSLGGSACAKGTSKFLKSWRQDTSGTCMLFSVHNTSPMLTPVRPWSSKNEYDFCSLWLICCVEERAKFYLQQLPFAFETTGRPRSRTEIKCPEGCRDPASAQISIAYTISSRPYRERISAKVSTAAELTFSKWLHIWRQRKVKRSMKFRAGQKEA